MSQSQEGRKEDRLAALSLANNCYKFIMDLTTNGVVITDAIKYVQGQMDHLNKQEKEILQDIKQENETEDAEQREGEWEGEGEETTTNGVF
jgi:hemerythrin-like domain-containing protein